MTVKILNIVISLFAAMCIAIPSMALENDSTKVKSEKEVVTIFKTIQSEKVPSITIKTAINSIIENKKTNNLYPATLTFKLKDGTMLEKSIELKPRGKSRRKYCEFPPLQVRFSKKELKARGISTDHKNLKLVTHCLESNTATPSILKEYLAYKIYNELSPNGLDAQLLATKYEDIHTGTVLERYAVLLEDIDELAERLDGKEVDGYSREKKEFIAENIDIFSLFQYMIGNADWDIPVIRNIKFIKVNNEKKLIAVPYDFDSAGFVSTPYAIPNPNYKLESIKQRFFMGDFKNKQARQKTIAHFNQKKENIYQLVNDFKEMDELTKIEVKEYLDSFYKTINKSQLVKRAFPVNGKIPEVSDMEGEMH